MIILRQDRGIDCIVGHCFKCKKEIYLRREDINPHFVYQYYHVNDSKGEYIMAKKKKPKSRIKYINCYNCNTENESDAKVCMGCGADLTDNEEKKGLDNA